MSLLTLHQINIKEAPTALASLSLSIDKKSITLITAPSGFGKSLLAAFILDPTSFSYAGHIHHFANHSTLIYQNAEQTLSPSRTIKQHIQDIQDSQTQPIPHSTLLNYMQLPLSLLNQYPSSLSSGQIQAVNIILAVATKATLIIADEPLTSLDSRRRQCFEKLIVNLKNQGKSVLILSRHQHDHASYIDQTICLSPQKNQAKLQIPHHISKSTLLSFHDFTISTHQRLIQPFQANITQQNCVGLLGENGCGKSTFLRAIMQLHPYEGSIHLHNQDISTMSDKKRHQSLQIMLQNPLATFNPYHLLTHITQDPSINFERFFNILKRFQVSLGALYPHQLPRSDAQIISLARTLSRQAQVFLLDEPTSHMSTHATQITIDIIKELQQDGASFILTSHQPEFIKSVCPTIWTIEQQCLHIHSSHSFY